MRIVHTESSCGWGGQEIRILTEARGMIERGHTATLVCPPTSWIFRAAAAYGVPAIAVPIYKKRPADLLALRRWLRENGPIDVINTHSSTDSWLAALACASIRNAPPLVRTRHISSAVPNNRSSRWLYQTATALIVTTGEALRQQLISDNGFAPARIVSVTTGIDGNRFFPGNRESAKRALNLPTDQFLYGIVATLRFQKGHAELLRAFATQDDPACCLAIVGDGPQMENITQLVAELGLTERVWLPGNQHEVLPWYQAFDAFILPTHAEGMPQSLIQAMLCALPVITTPVGSIPHAVKHGESGLLVPPKNTTELCAAMCRVRTDPQLCQRLGANARRVALTHFGVARMLDEMEAHFANTILEYQAHSLHPQTTL